MDFFYTGFRRFSSERKKETFQKRIRVPTHTNYFQLLGNNVIATSTVIIDRTKVIPFKMQDTYYDDFDCWLHLLKNNVKAIGIDEVQMLYRIVPGSVSRNKLKSAKFVWKALREREKLRLLSAIFHFWRYFFQWDKKILSLIFCLQKLFLKSFVMGTYNSFGKKYTSPFFFENEFMIQGSFQPSVRV